MNTGTIPLSKPRKGSTQASPVYLLTSLNPGVPESYPGSRTTFSFFSSVSCNLSSSSAFPSFSWHWHFTKITGQLHCQTSLSFGLSDVFPPILRWGFGFLGWRRRGAVFPQTHRHTVLFISYGWFSSLPASFVQSILPRVGHKKHPPPYVDARVDATYQTLCWPRGS